MGKRGPKPLDLASRLHPHLSSTDPAEHWFWCGSVSQSKPGRVGKRGQRYMQRKATGGAYVRLSNVARKAQIKPHCVSYLGQTMTIYRALAHYHRGHEWPGLKLPDWRGFEIVRTCAARDARGIRCCNPWCAAIRYVPPPPRRTGLEPLSAEERVAELADLIADWCDRHENAERAAYEALFVEPGDWSAADLAQALQRLWRSDALSPRWRTLLALPGTQALDF